MSTPDKTEADQYGHHASAFARPLENYSAAVLPPRSPQEAKNDPNAATTPDQYRRIIQSWAEGHPTGAFDDLTDDRIDDLVDELRLVDSRRIVNNILEDNNRCPGLDIGSCSDCPDCNGPFPNSPNYNGPCPNCPNYDGPYLTPIPPNTPYVYPPDYDGPNPPEYDARYPYPHDAPYQKQDLRHTEDFVEKNFQLLYDSFAAQFSSLHDYLITELRLVDDNLRAVFSVIDNQTDVLQNQTNVLNDVYHGNGTFYVDENNGTLLLKNNGGTVLKSAAGSNGSNWEVECVTSAPQAAALTLLCSLVVFNLALVGGWWFQKQKKRDRTGDSGSNFSLANLGPSGAR